MRKIIFLACATLLLSLLPMTMYARTLQPGNVYEFVGRDARVVSHVSVTGAGRYEIVAWNERGEVTRFGTGSGRFSVSGTGGVAISPFAPITVSYDSSRVTLRQSPGTALRQIEVQTGQTLKFQNNQLANAHIRTSHRNDTRFDYVILNRIEDVVNFSRDVELAQIRVPVEGAITITATGNPVILYFPTRWLGDGLQVTTLDHPALASMELLAGQTYAFENYGTTMRTLRISQEFAGAIFP